MTTRLRGSTGISAKVIGDLGTLKVFNFEAPHMFNRLSLTVNGRKCHTPADDAVITMNLIDQIYAAAGMRRRASRREVQRTPRGRNWTLIRGPVCRVVFGTQ